MSPLRAREHLPAKSHAAFQLSQLLLPLGLEAIATRWGRKGFAGLAGPGEAQHAGEGLRCGAWVGFPEEVPQHGQEDGPARNGFHDDGGLGTQLGEPPEEGRLVHEPAADGGPLERCAFGRLPEM